MSVDEIKTMYDAATWANQYGARIIWLFEMKTWVITDDVVRGEDYEFHKAAKIFERELGFLRK